MSSSRVIAAFAVASALGIGLLVLQRWVADTKAGAIVLVSIWFAVIGLAALAYARRRPELRVPILGTYAAIAVASVAIGYITGFRDTEVDEDVVMASERVAESERDSALAGGDASEPIVAKPKDESAKPSGPVELAQGGFTGADGHAGTGVATVVRDTDGSRSLTFTEFEVDPGAKVVVWLTRDAENLDDRIELGGLKGNVGDQEYEVPEDADLRDYDTVVLYCTPFTVRIAVAPLS